MGLGVGGAGSAVTGLTAALTLSLPRVWPRCQTGFPAERRRGCFHVSCTHISVRPFPPYVAMQREEPEVPLPLRRSRLRARAALHLIGCRLFPRPAARSFHLNVSGERRVGGDKSSDRGATWRRRESRRRSGRRRSRGGHRSVCVRYRLARRRRTPRLLTKICRLALSHSDSDLAPTATTHRPIEMQQET